MCLLVYIVYWVGSSIEDSVANCYSLLISVKTWYFQNYLSLNIAKTQFCIFSNGSMTSNPRIIIDDAVIEAQNSLCLFGVTLDPTLNELVCISVLQISQFFK